MGNHSNMTEIIKLLNRLEKGYEFITREELSDEEIDAGIDTANSYIAELQALGVKTEFSSRFFLCGWKYQDGMPIWFEGENNG